jgi:repressor LexA
LFGAAPLPPPRERSRLPLFAGAAMPLTKRHREILHYLTLYSEQKGYAPSFEVMADNFNDHSLATVHELLSNLERKGYIKR